MEDFIKHNQGSKEAGIVVVYDEATLQSADDLLIGYGFNLVRDSLGAIDLVLKSQRVLIVEDIIKKDVANFYDFLHEMASGSVKLNSNSHVLTEDFNLVILLSTIFIDSELELGRDWLSVGGLVFQFSE